MKLVVSISIFVATAAIMVGCQQNNHHAPVCPYGQVLMYSSGNYSCAYQSTYTTSGLYGMNLNGQPQVGPNGAAVVTPPIASCGVANQTLVNWNGTWLCYTNDVIYPGGDNSPGGVTPPPGRGGEFCNSFGAGAYAMWGNFGVPNGAMNQFSNVVTCSPGFSCQPSSAANNSATNAIPFAGQFMGQAGTCVYGGYHGSY